MRSKSERDARNERQIHKYEDILETKHGKPAWQDRGTDTGRLFFMEVMQNIKNRNNNGTLDDAMAVILSKLDDAIDDVENGRVISEEELWAEIDAI